MSLSIKIFIVYAIFVSLCSYFVIHSVMEEIRPGVRQSTEETLVDTANLLAEMLADSVKNRSLDTNYWERTFHNYGKRNPKANIWGMEKQTTNHRIYVTDRYGIVLLDSHNIAVGQDYSKWRDVYLTLRGSYGARTTRDDPKDEQSTIMYVAAPIKDGEKIIGVVTVAKPNRTVQPYILRTQMRLRVIVAVFIVFGLLVGALFSWWLGRELGRLRHYAQNVSSGNRVTLDASKFISHELKQLAQALESMREELDGKAYIEGYIQTLTHELKSPLAGIKASAELLQNPMPLSKQQQFVDTIDAECLRLQQLIDRLLDLAKIEQQQTLGNIQSFNLYECVQQLLELQLSRTIGNNITINNDISPTFSLRADYFLLQQALTNLLDNAIEFTATNGCIDISIQATSDEIVISVFNQGNPIPDYALPRLTERFYSLARPSSGRKSTGLGLNFVQEIAALHSGALTITNITNGVMAQIHISRHL